MILCPRGQRKEKEYGPVSKRALLTKSRLELGLQNIKSKRSSHVHDKSGG